MAYNASASNEDKFNLLLQNIHTSLLKKNGFKKQGQNFRLIKQSGIVYFGYIINFQKSQYNSINELRFTVNLGRIYFIGPCNKQFKEYDCSGKDRERLSFLTPQYGFDYWWTITQNKDMYSLENELVNLLEEFALPWFDIQESPSN